MSKILVLTSSQGQSLDRLNDSSWSKLLKLNNGNFSENQTQFIFETSEGTQFVADKTVFDEDDSKISYVSSLEEIGGPQIIIDKIKEVPNTFYLRGFYPGSFILIVNVGENFQTESQGDWLKKRLNPSELGFLANALLKNLFPKPTKGAVLLESHEDSSCTLYFNRTYHTELLSAMQSANSLGKFTSSNAERDWVNLMRAIEEAINAGDIDKEALTSYSITK
jgi:hypothetical protein